jgi:hypothetical protein
VDISPRDAFMSMKAAARIFNQPGVLKADAEEDDSGSASANEETTATDD